MRNLRIALTYLRTRALVSSLTAMSVALGLGLAIIVLSLVGQATATLRTETGYWDMVIGAKGSPLQVVLNGLYYLDAPTGNIDKGIWDELKQDGTIACIVPLNMGDNYLGAPIIGTTPSFFADRHAPGGQPLLAAGRLFTRPFEVVVGAEIAHRRALRLGQHIVGAHGWGISEDVHKDSPYTVVGILTRTGASLDRAVYTDYRSVWEVHAHHHHDEEASGAEHAAAEHESAEEHLAAGADHDDHGHDHDHAEHAAAEHAAAEHAAAEEHVAAVADHDDHDHAEHGGQEVTSLLLRFYQPARRFTLQREINAHRAAMAVIPVDEIDRLAKTFLAPLQGILLLVAYLVVVVSALSILISLYLTILQRRRDLAIFRSLGATRGDVFRLITWEAALLSGVGVIGGWILGHALLSALHSLILARFGISMDPWQVQPVEFVIAVSVWALGVIAGLLPAIVAYRLPVAETFAKEL